MKSILNGIATTITALVIFIVTLSVVYVPHVLLDAYVFQHLWLWFVTEPFDILEITFSQSIGIGFIVAFLAIYFNGERVPQLINETDEDKKKRDLLLVFGKLFGSQILIFIISWIYYTYFMIG